MTEYIDQFNPEQTLKAIAASLRWNPDLPGPVGSGAKAKTIRAREAMFKDGDYQNFQAQKLYFSPFGVNNTVYTAAEANTMRLKASVDNMSDEQVNKFERIYQAYPNQSPGFYGALVANPDFDVNHPQFEDVASIDLEENTRRQAEMMPTQVGPTSWIDDALKLYGGEPFVPVPGSYYSAARQRRSARTGLALPTGNVLADSAGTLPSGYGGLYGAGSLAGTSEGINNALGGAMEAANRAGEGVEFLDPFRWAARNVFSVLAAPGQAIQGGIRSFAGGLEQGDFGKAALGALSTVGVGGLIGNAIYGDENFNSAWEQTFAGQMRQAGINGSGEGWFPAGKVAELQARQVYQTASLDNQVWSLGVQSAHALGMDPASSAYHFLSGTIDAIASIGLDPLTYVGGLALPTKAFAAAGRGVGKVAVAVNASEKTVKAASTIESITLRGGARRAQTNARVMAQRNREARTAKALESGQTYEGATFARQVLNYVVQARSGGPITQALPEGVANPGLRGAIRAAQDFVAERDAMGISPHMDDQVALTRDERRALKRQLASDIKAPDDLTGADADFYVANMTLLRNQKLHDKYLEQSVKETDTAAGLRRPEQEQKFVSTYTADVGEQLDLAASKKMGDIGTDLRAQPEMADSFVKSTLDDMQENLGMSVSEARASMEATIGDSPYGPLPESIYTIGEPVAERAFGRIRGQDAIVQFKRAKRIDPGDPIIEEAQKILTDPRAEADPVRIDAINDSLLERLNVDPAALKEGFPQPLDVSKDFDYAQFTSMLFDKEGNMVEGADQMAALLRLTNTEPKFKYNLALAGEDVPMDVALGSRRVLLEVAKKTKRSMNQVVDKHMSAALADIGNKDLTVSQIREDILAMTDLEHVVEATLGRVIDGGGAITYGELLSLAGRVGGHGKLAELLSQGGTQGIKALDKDGNAVWWADRSIMKAGSVDIDGMLGGAPAAVGPLKHNDPLYFLISRKLGEPYKAKTIHEARREAQKEQRLALGEYFKNIRLGAKSAAKARESYTYVQRKQNELQYNAAKAISAMDVERLAGKNIPQEVLDFLDGVGARPSDEVIMATMDELEQIGRAAAESNNVLMDSVRSDNGIFTDWRGDIPITDPMVTLVDAKKNLNYDGPLHPILRRAISSLAKETSEADLRVRTKNKWDNDVYGAALANAKKTETLNPDGTKTPFTDEMRENEFIRLAASQLGHDMKSSIRGIRTVIDPADGAKLARTKRTIGDKLDRWSSFVPNAQRIDLSNKTAVAQRILDYGIFHKLGPAAMNESLAILHGTGNTQQLSRLALQDALNKTNDAIVEGFKQTDITTGKGKFYDFNDTEWSALKEIVRKQTRIWSESDNKLRQTYLQETAIGPKRTWPLEENGKPVLRVPHSHVYLNEQVNNFIDMPSTADLIGLTRKADVWRKVIARSKFIGTKSWETKFGSFGKALELLYMNYYRTSLLLRPAYIVRNLLEMDVRSFLANSPVAMFSHPLNYLSTMIGEVAPRDSPLAKANRPVRLWLKETFGMFDQTPLGKDVGAYAGGDEAASLFSQFAYHIERGKHAMSDERLNQTAAIYGDYEKIPITDERWVGGVANELYSQRTNVIARMVARNGLTKTQMRFLNKHLESQGRESLAAVQQAGDLETKLYPVAVFMYEALNNPDELKKSLREFYKDSSDFEPGSLPKIDDIGDWSIDSIHQHLDSIRTSGSLQEGVETPTTILMTDSPQNLLTSMITGAGGYVERIRDHTFGGDQRLLDYIGHGGFHPDGIPIGQAIPEQVEWLTDLRKPENEVRAVKEAINNNFRSQIDEARRTYSADQGGTITPEASEIAQMTSRVHTFVQSEKMLTRNAFNSFTDWFFGSSSKVERRAKMGPEYRAHMWGVMGDSVDELSVAALAESEQAALRTLSPLRRLTRGLPGPEIGRSHKYFKGIERRQAEVDDYNLAKAEVKTAKAEGREPPPEAVEKMAKYSQGLDLESAYEVADTMAYEYVKDLFYDASQKRNLWYSMRYASMFAAPAVNTLTVWTKLMTENPTQIYKAYKAAYALQSEGTGDVLNGPEEGMDEVEKALHATDPNKAFLFKDATGWQVNVPLIGKLTAMFPGGVTPGMVGPITMRTENLNFAMSGGSILPGVSPMVSISYKALRGDTDNILKRRLDGWMIPYGDRSLLENAMPSWLIGTLAGLASGKLSTSLGMSDELVLRNLKPAMAVLYGSGKYQNVMTDPTVNSKFMDDAKNLAADMTFWQSVGQGILPSRPLTDWAVADKTGDSVGIASLASLFYDDYYPNSNYDYENAMLKLYDDFGMEALFAITGGKENVGKIPSSSGYDWIVANPDLAKAYDKYIYYFFPADEGDMRARIWMEERGLRTQLDANELKAAVRSQYLVAMKAQINNKYVNGLVTKDEAAQLKKDAATKMGDASEYEQKDIATPQQFPNILDEMLKRPEFLNTPAGQPAAYAMSWRKYYMDQAEATGESLGTKKNTDLKAEYYARLSGIIAQTGGERSQSKMIIDMLMKEF